MSLCLFSAGVRYMAQRPRQPKTTGAMPKTLSMPVSRDGQSLRAYADQMVAGLSMSLDVELSFVVMESEMQAVNFAQAKIEGSDVVALATTGAETQNRVREIAVIRMKPDSALNSAHVILLHLARHKLVTAEQLAAALAVTMPE